VKDVFFIYCGRSNVERSDWMEKVIFWLVLTAPIWLTCAIHSILYVDSNWWMSREVDTKKIKQYVTDFVLQILEVEPYISKWHFYLYKALHGTRKLRPRPMPLGQERLIVDDPLSISYFAMCLAQIINEKTKRQKIIQSPNSHQYPCWFGRIRFETPLDILTAIQDRTLLVSRTRCFKNCNIIKNWQKWCVFFTFFTLQHSIGNGLPLGRSIPQPQRNSHVPASAWASKHWARNEMLEKSSQVE